MKTSCASLITVVVLAVLAVLAGCHQPKQGFEFVEANHEGVIWRSGKTGLLASADYFSNNSRANLVMVSFWAGSELEEILKNKPNTLALKSTSAPGRSHALVEIASEAELNEIAQAAHQGHYFGCGNLEVISGLPLTRSETVYAPIYSESILLPEVATAITKINGTRIRTDIATLEAMGTRHHSSSSGLLAPSTIKTMFEQAGAGIPGFSVKLWDHAPKGRTSQSSVVATIAGTEDDATTVIFGSHLDSINKDGPTEPAPGADDNASGVATLVEVVRAIAASGATFKRRIEFHAYAAEEVGLVGSSEIAESYANSNRAVAAMLQIDMNAFSTNPESRTIYLVTTDTSAHLRRSLKDLLSTYLGGDFEEMDLSGGTSDHKAWRNKGFSAVFPFENPRAYNRALHTKNDTSATANNAALSARFAQLSVAFASHQAGLTSAAASYTSGLISNGVSSDLALAIVSPADSAKTEDYFQVGVGASPDVVTLEYCLITSVGGPCASSGLQTAEPATGGTAAAGRSLFLDLSAIEIPENSLIRAAGYNTANKKIAERTARLSKN